MQLSLFSDSFESIEGKKKPTLTQYLKQKKGKKTPKQFLVKKIWKPNKYPSYQLETEHFRCSVAKDSSFGISLQAEWDTVVRTEKPILLEVKVTDNKPDGFRFSHGAGEGMWYDIGTSPVLGVEWKQS